MSILNASPLTLSVNIFQLAVNIILRGIYKLVNWFVVSVCSLVCSVSVLSYKLGYRMGSRRMWNQAKYIFQDTAKIASKDLWKTWKP